MDLLFFGEFLSTLGMNCPCLMIMDLTEYLGVRTSNCDELSIIPNFPLAMITYGRLIKGTVRMKL